MRSSACRAVARATGSRARSPNRKPHTWYRRGTDRYVQCVQIVQNRGRIARSGRWRTHRHDPPLGWGPKGRWFKSSRPDPVRGLRNVGHAVAVGPRGVDPVAAVAAVVPVVGHEAALHVVVAAAAVQLVGLVPAVEEVIAAAAEDRVSAVVARELVVAAAAGQDVAPALAADEVVATEPVDLITAPAPDDHVAAVGPVDVVVARRTEDCGLATKTLARSRIRRRADHEARENDHQRDGTRQDGPSPTPRARLMAPSVCHLAPSLALSPGRGVSSGRDGPVTPLTPIASRPD